MKKSSIILVLLMGTVIMPATYLSTLPQARAWGLSTHMFIASEAMFYISDQNWSDAFAFYAPEIMQGSTTPDQEWQDWDNHLYYPETGRYYAPQAAARWFGFARDNFTAGNWEDGFFAVGVMTHYFSDPCIPVHTDEWWSGHTGYERDINENLLSLDIEVPTEVEVGNVSQEVVDRAIIAHQYYDTVRAKYDDEDSRALDDPEIKALTEKCLSMAINGCLSLFYTLSQFCDAPDVTIEHDYTALIDYAHSNDYISVGGVSQLTSVNQTLSRNGFKLIIQNTAITPEDLINVDLFIATCAFDEYTSAELSAIATWAASGAKGILLTSRGDFSTYTNIARPNQILEALGSYIRLNDDNVYMQGTYQPWYNDIYTIPPPSSTINLTYNVNSMTLFSPSSLYFTEDEPIHPIIMADESAYQTDQNPPGIERIYDDTEDGKNGDQIPLVAVEEIGNLRLMVAGTTFFSDYDYGKGSFDNVQLLENFLSWVVGLRSENNVPASDQIGPKISSIEWTLEGASATITAEVTDPSGIQQVRLEYSQNGLSSEAAMIESTSGIYSVTIDIVNDPLNFSIRAVDNEENEAVRGPYVISPSAEDTTTIPMEWIVSSALVLCVGAIIAIWFIQKRR